MRDVINMDPIFLFSLPRSGSSWVQRLLATNQKIKTVSEPWVMLPPLLPVVDGVQVFSQVGGDHLAAAIPDFIEKLQHKKKSYYAAVQAFGNQVYKDLAIKDDFDFVLDKTPRYYFIAQHLHEAFPNAKFIYLWRNPLAILASIYETWGSKKSGIERNKVDLFEGLERLVSSYLRFGESSLSLNYEYLLLEPKRELERVSKYLGVDFSYENFLQTDSIEIEGRMGDPLAQYNGHKLVTERLGAWENSLRNIHRRSWANNYLDWIGGTRLSHMGYNIEELRSQLNRLPKNYDGCILDISKAVVGKLLTYFAFDVHFTRHKLKADKKISFPYT